jgi:hypothetical protein
VTAALGIAIVVLALAALYFAGESREWKVKAVNLEISEKAAIRAMELSEQARKDERARFEEALRLARQQLDAEIEANASNPDPAVRRSRLRDLGRVLSLVPPKDGDGGPDRNG